MVSKIFGPLMMKQTTLKAFISFLLISQFHIGTLAQQDEDQDPTENSGGVIQRYGRNAANNLGSILADPDSVPLLREYSPVTDEILQNPSDADWLTWRRTYNNQGFSNLDFGAVGDMSGRDFRQFKRNLTPAQKNQIMFDPAYINQYNSFTGGN